MENITTNILEAIEIAEPKYKNDNKTAEFEEALNKFEELVKKGLTQKRGNNLMSITEIHLHRLEFNIIDSNSSEKFAIL